MVEFLSYASRHLKGFLELPYEELEERNLLMKEKVKSRLGKDAYLEMGLRQITDEPNLKAVTVCFSDLEGKLHMLDYDKKFLLKSYDNLTFDGSSVRGFTEVNNSDLRLEIDWSSLRWFPADVFGPGKVYVFGLIKDRDGTSFAADFRGRLKELLENLHSTKGYGINIAVECEGFLFKGINAEQQYSSSNQFLPVSEGGYYHSLPNDPLRLFIDKLADTQRALGFENEKDHPEVAPSQFELNYSYSDALLAADQLQLYKLSARQVAANFNLTASFLPKPIAGINGSGMHTNLSITKDNKNIFFDSKGEEQLSPMAWEFIDRLLINAESICLTLNSSVNAYRRLDPHFEAPNQIKSSAVDRTSMIRIPLGNEKSSRIEVRTVAPDANPYLAFYTLIQAGLNGPMGEKITSADRKVRAKFLPGNIYEALIPFQESAFMAEILGTNIRDKYSERKLAAANRCPKELGSLVKKEEVLFHHEVTNQSIWSNF
jgi:glutamine synthetase